MTHPLEVELPAIVADWITNQPRSLQTRIGPSEVGIECQRRIGHTLAGTPKINNPVKWPAFAGTAMHHEFAMIFELDAMKNHDGGRWHVEEKVDVAPINGTDIDGSSDLYDEQTETVVDWKFVTRARLREYRRHGPGEQYRAQVHAYGIGWARRGLPVTTVGVFFWTRDGEFTDRYFWHEPFDPEVAIAAFERAHDISQLVEALTPAVALPLLPTADSFCTHCPWWVPNATDLATACPGHPDSRAASTPPGSIADALGTH